MGKKYHLHCVQKSVNLFFVQHKARKSPQKTVSKRMFISHLDSNLIRTIQMCFICNGGDGKKTKKMESKQRPCAADDVPLIWEFVLIGQMRHCPEEIPGQPLKWATAGICFSYNLNTGCNNIEPYLTSTACTRHRLWCLHNAEIQTARCPRYGGAPRVSANGRNRPAVWITLQVAARSVSPTSNPG